MPYKRIIVAVDGSKTSELALMDAIYLAKSL
jgi:nucleotide-binding universal stress UspA family protein